MKARIFRWKKEDIGRFDGSEKLVAEIDIDVIPQISSYISVNDESLRVVDIGYIYDDKTRVEILTTDII
jgi:hypothetical protein